MRIPLFPLNVVLFPGGPLPLHVFEPRYRAMMADVLGPEEAPSSEPGFGVACIREGLEVGVHAETHDVGCFAVVEQVRRHPDGTMDLLARGTFRFRITRRPPDDPYPRADLERLDETPGPAPEEALRLARSALDRYRSAIGRATRTAIPGLEVPDDPIAASYAAAGSLAIELSRRQELLEAPNASDRLARIAAMAGSEATLLDTVGPPVQRPQLHGQTLN